MPRLSARTPRKPGWHRARRGAELVREVASEEESRLVPRAARHVRALRSRPLLDQYGPSPLMAGGGRYRRIAARVPAAVVKLGSRFGARTGPWVSGSEGCL